MFLASQLDELSQRLRADIDDLRILFQEEGLPLNASDSVEHLSRRLHSDARFRRDVVFLLQSMLGRGPDEVGSMDLLGVLLITAAGTRQQFDSPPRQQLLRELLRFVIQQRRPAPLSPLSPIERSDFPLEQGGPSTPLTEPIRGPMRRQTADAVTPLPSLLRDVLEEPTRQLKVGRIAVAACVLLCAGLLVWQSSFRGVPQKAGSSLPSATGVAATAPVRLSPRALTETPAEIPRAIPPTRVRRLSHSPFHPESSALAQPRSQVNVPAQTSALPEAVADARPAQNLPTQSQQAVARHATPDQSSAAAKLASSSTQQSPTSKLPSGTAAERSAPHATDLAGIFAQPRSKADALADQPPPAFRHRDPILIARNTAAPLDPAFRGTVHTGSAGTMASSLMYSPEPVYPAKAIAAGVQGEVNVRAVVGPDGNVIDASIVSGPPALREAALEAVGRWRYRPFEQKDRPGTMATNAILDFQLSPAR